jgi:hypothetical protein
MIAIVDGKYVTNFKMTEDRYYETKRTGMFFEFFPECCGVWEIDKDKFDVEEEGI